MKGNIIITIGDKESSIEVKREKIDINDCPLDNWVLERLRDETSNMCENIHSNYCPAEEKHEKRAYCPLIQKKKFVLNNEKLMEKLRSITYCRFTLAIRKKKEKCLVAIKEAKQKYREVKDFDL